MFGSDRTMRSHRVVDIELDDLETQQWFLIWIETFRGIRSCHAWPALQMWLSSLHVATIVTSGHRDRYCHESVTPDASVTRSHVECYNGKQMSSQRHLLVMRIIIAEWHHNAEMESDLQQIPIFSVLILRISIYQKGRYLRQQQYVLQRIISGVIKGTATLRVWWRLMQIIKWCQGLGTIWCLQRYFEFNDDKCVSQHSLSLMKAMGLGQIGGNKCCND